MDITAFVTQQLQNNFFTGAAMGGILLGGLAYLRNVPVAVFKRVKTFLTVSLTVHSLDPLYDSFFKWLELNKFDALGKKYRVRTAESDEEEGSSGRIIGPDYGTHWFRWNGTFIRAEVSQDQRTIDTKKQTNDFLTISYFGFNRALLDRIFKEVKEIDTSDDGYVDIRMITSSWRGGFESQRPIKLSKDRLPSVILDNGELQAIEADVEHFLSRRSWYEQCQIPYRRGYLLKGPPGTGKSSLVKWLAVRFGMDIYMPNKNSAQNLADWIRTVPKHSIVLFEEVDTIYKKRGKTEGEDDNEMAQVVQEVMMDFASILNALDGLIAAEDIIIVMTTNHPEKLDPALIRPGRVDYQMEIGNASKEQSRQLFNIFFEDSGEEFAEAAGEKVYSPAYLKSVLMKSSDGQDAVKRLQKEQQHSD